MTRPADMEPLIRRIRAFMDGPGVVKAGWKAAGRDELAGRFGYSDEPLPQADVLFLAETSVELGSPPTASHAVLLVTWKPGAVEGGRVTVVGPDVGDIALQGGAGARGRPFAQVVMLELSGDGSPEWFSVEQAQYLVRRLPGYMSRTVPGRLWVRFGREAMLRGLDLRIVGSALVARYSGAFREVAEVETLFVTSCAPDVDEVGRAAMEAEILWGRHRKLYIGGSGEVECTDLGCDTCEEKQTCDALRDISVKNRGVRHEGAA
jgi:hypothetical protein